MILSNNAVNDDPDFVFAEVCANGVTRTYEGYIYLSLQDANSGKIPGLTSSVDWWSLVGVSNRNAMFDSSVSTTTKRAESLSVTLAVSHVTSVSLPYVSGAEVLVTVRKGGVIIYDRVVDMRDNTEIVDWSSYWYTDRKFRHSLALVDIPPIPEIEITITVNYPLNTAEIGMIHVGRVLNVGFENYGLNRELIDYTQVTFDKFGAMTLDKQKYAKKYRCDIEIPNNQFDLMTESLDSIASTPVVCIGGNGLFQSLIVYGLMSYSINLKTYSTSFITLEVKGLVS